MPKTYLSLPKRTKTKTSTGFEIAVAREVVGEDGPEVTVHREDAIVVTFRKEDPHAGYAVKKTIGPTNVLRT